MNLPTKSRAHLVERAVEALGKGEGAPPLQPTAPVPAASAPTAPPPPKAAEVSAQTTLSVQSLADAGLVSVPNGQKRSRVVEEITLVQQQVLRCMDEAGGGRARIVVVTSARPGEGKTFVALNLAASLAANGTRKVILVDADGKRGSISDNLATGVVPGLRALISQERSSPALLPTEVRNFSFLPYGRVTEGSSSLPPGSLVAEALSRLARAMPEQVLVVDTPPSLSTGDAHALSSIAGQVVMVVDAEKTQRNEVEAALDMMEACPTLSLVLNRVCITANDSFGAYGDYGAGHAD